MAALFNIHAPGKIPGKVRSCHQGNIFAAIAAGLAIATSPDSIVAGP
ncbi:hypothetical protein [Bradyrhizobium sp.]|nr:hypothetical protein [Bradyrhizobium sp.]MDP3078957.1 hypothetical protein [Bradyrhizobium sp.]